MTITDRDQSKMTETKMLDLPNGFAMEVAVFGDVVTVRLFDAEREPVKMLPEVAWFDSTELVDRTPVGSASFWVNPGVLLGKYLAQATEIALAARGETLIENPGEVIGR